MLPELEFGIGDWVTIESKVLKTDLWKTGHVWTDRMSGLVIEIEALAKTEHNTIRATGYIVTVLLDGGLGLYEFGTSYWKIWKNDKGEKDEEIKDR